MEIELSRRASGIRRCRFNSFAPALYRGRSVAAKRLQTRPGTCCSLFTFGRGDDRGNITKEREWQQRPFSREDHGIAQLFMQARANEEIKRFSLRPTFGKSCRAGEFFRDGPVASLELVAPQEWNFMALPFVTGRRLRFRLWADAARVLGLAVPVEKIYPWPVLSEWKTAGPSQRWTVRRIKPAADGMSVPQYGKRLGVAGAQAGQPGATKVSSRKLPGHCGQLRLAARIVLTSSQKRSRFAVSGSSCRDVTVAWQHSATVATGSSHIISEEGTLECR